VKFRETRGAKFDRDGAEGQFLLAGGASRRCNDSLVLRLRYRNRALLLPGDAEKDGERSILSEDSGQALQADILKATMEARIRRHRSSWLL
jgi:beta-lactamase superfamily II metal-dependent hydrolase